jgi:hypothetical protein
MLHIAGMSTGLHDFKPMNSTQVANLVQACPKLSDCPKSKTAEKELVKQQVHCTEQPLVIHQQRH